jgi:hypothetical protein
MPPSGYSSTQANHIENFLVSCGQSLVQEGKLASRTPEQSILFELENIKKLLADDSFSLLEKSLFQINGTFYRKLLSSSSLSNYDDLMETIKNEAKKAHIGFLDVEKRSRGILSTANCLSKES